MWFVLSNQHLASNYLVTMKNHSLFFNLWVLLYYRPINPQNPRLSCHEWNFLC